MVGFVFRQAFEATPLTRKNISNTFFNLNKLTGQEREGITHGVDRFPTNIPQNNDSTFRKEPFLHPFPDPSVGGDPPLAAEDY